MNSDTLMELFQKSYRVTLGAASTAVEAVKDPQRAANDFSTVGNDFQQLADRLEVRGALTEKEARDFVEEMMSQLPEPFRSVSSSFSAAPETPTTVTTVATPVVDAELQAEVSALTAELIAIRKEIEDLKQKDL